MVFRRLPHFRGATAAAEDGYRRYRAGRCFIEDLRLTTDD